VIVKIKNKQPFKPNAMDFSTFDLKIQFNALAHLS